ncbi:HotDog domain-containing protein [Chytridium lagenaria]|nr:HotDog domain-containing protein [Chytridium lagenaria]
MSKRQPSFIPYLAVAAVSAVTGAAIAIKLIPTITALLSPLTPKPNKDDKVIHYTPSDDLIKLVDSLPVVQRLRSIEPPLEFIPFRPLLTDVLIDETPSPTSRSKKVIVKDTENPNAFSDQLIRGATLYGPGRIEYAFGMFSRPEKTLIKVTKLGDSICGHSGLVHGGMIAALFDDFMGALFFTNAQGEYSGFTANLSVDYRYPVPAPSTVVLVIWIDKEEGRKIFIRGEMRSAEGVKAFADKGGVTASETEGERWGNRGV